MGASRPTDAHRRLAVFAGTWVAEERLFPTPSDPRGGRARGQITARVGLDGLVLLSDYEREQDGAVVYRGHGVHGWDAERERYTLCWFDTAGGAFEHFAAGMWGDDDLTYEIELPRGHVRHVYTPEAEGGFLFRIDVSKDRRLWHPFLEGTYR